MKKRIMIINSVVVFTMLSLFLIFCILGVSYYNNARSRDSLKENLKFVTALYTETTSEEDVINIVNSINKNLRVTFIGSDGMVIADSSGLKDFTSHLDRPEILDLDTVYQRYSDSLGVNMLYVATRDLGIYVRVSRPLTSITGAVYGFLVFGVIALLLTLAVSLIILRKTTQKVLVPLNRTLSRLSEYAGNSNQQNVDDLDFISIQVAEIHNLIEQKVNEITDEKSKVDFVMNSMDEGIIVIDSEGKVVLVNDYILERKQFHREEVNGRNYLYLFRDIDFQNRIALIIQNGNFYQFDVTESGKIYEVTLSAINSKWTDAISGRFGCVAVVNDVTEIRKLEHMKREFFANASHELKSPLTTIIGYQQMILEGIVNTPEDIADASHRTVREANRMHKIIMEMLELSHLEILKEPYEIETLNVRNTVTDIIESSSLKIKEKKLKVELKLDDFMVKMNPSHLQQLMRNLIDNAIKYNKQEGLLEIIVSKDKKIISVRDTGIGISDQDKSRVFERFYRVDKARSKELGGTGLGLSIVKHICQLYRLKINLTSRIGNGTQVTIQFSE
jgi:two-component system phosphate regulon sensor histidine kinase PhoR